MTRQPNSETRNSGDGPKSPQRMPREFGRYRIIRRLGKGGMGTVFLAEDTQLERRVALKVPQFEGDDGQEMLERFYREARAAATIHHPNLCPVHDVGEIDGIHYLTMAYIEGRPLSDVIQPDQPLPQQRAAVIVWKLALAMTEAHEKGIVHRDLKPSNIFLNQRDEPVVMDFGLARRSDSQDARLTKSGAVIGTPAYMAPEQIRGDTEEIGPACDIYSLGVIFYELLTGTLPFDGPIAAVLGQVLTQEPPHPSSLRPDLDRRLEAVCLKMMAKNREDRYRSMHETAEAVKQALMAPPAGAPQKTPPPSYPLTPAEPQDRTSFPSRLRSRRDPVDGVLRFVRRTAAACAEFSRRRPQATAFTLLGGVLLIAASVISYDFLSNRGNTGTGGNSDGGQADDGGTSDDTDNVTLQRRPTITNSIGMKLALIPVGEFSMGTPASGSRHVITGDDEKPRHPIRITKPFFIGVHEVTQKQFEAVMGSGQNRSKFSGDNRPVDSVTWNDANEFCRLLSLKEGVAYGLPTEAMWEYACRGRSTTTWHFGDKPDRLAEYAWYTANSGGSTSDVGLLKPNAFGLYDVYGNVAEWCQDWYRLNYYSESPSLDPPGPDDRDASRLGFTKVVRGGSWDSIDANCRSAFRGTNSMMVRTQQTGFRVVRIAEEADLK